MPATLSCNKLLTDTGTLSRRELFKMATTAMAAAALLSVGGRLPKITPAISMPGALPRPATFTGAVSPAQEGELLANAKSLVRSGFAPYAGDTFQVWHESGEGAALQLMKVRDLVAARRLTARGLVIDAEQNFSLQFRGPLDRPLGQDIYRFAHTSIGDFALLIVPMRPEQDGRYYEAIFNRLRDEPVQ
jgi:hypothetical protein